MKDLHRSVDHIVHFINARNIDVALAGESTLLHYVGLTSDHIGIPSCQVNLLTRIKKERLGRLAAENDHLMRVLLQSETSCWTRIHKF